MADFWDEQDAKYGTAPQRDSTKIPPGGAGSPLIVSLANNGHHAGSVDTHPYRRAALAALRKEADNLAQVPPDTARNHTLNRATFSLTGLVANGSLTQAEVDAALWGAARACGLGDTEIAATYASGQRGSAEKVGARTVRIRASDEPPATDAGAVGEEAQAEARDLHDIAVQRKAYELRVLDEGRALWTVQRAELLGQQPPAPVSLPDLLAVPDPEVRYRVKDLLPRGGRALLAAQYKAGKTSLVANLLRSLVDGDPFLGAYATEPVKHVMLIDTELDQDMLRKWLRDQNIRNQAAISTLCLRGKLSTFGIINDRIRSDWAAMIDGSDFVILDCLRPCLDALGLSEDKEAGVFLTAFDALCKEASASEALMVHHMGHSNERSRGDSRLLDWPDAVWKMVRDTDEDGNDIESGDRFFSAVGRDVNVPESQLDWEPMTRALTICGGGRNDKKARSTVGDIVEIMSATDAADGLTRSQLERRLKGLGVGRNVARRAIQNAVDTLVLTIATGPRNSNIHTLNPSHLRRQ